MINLPLNLVQVQHHQTGFCPVAVEGLHRGGAVTHRYRPVTRGLHGLNDDVPDMLVVLGHEDQPPARIRPRAGHDLGGKGRRWLAEGEANPEPRPAGPPRLLLARGG